MPDILVAPDFITRQQAIALSGLSSGQLSRLDAAGTIVPHKIGSTAHPNVLYTPQQLEELKLVAKIKGRLTPAETKQAVAMFRLFEHKEAFLDGWIVLCRECLYFVADAALSEFVPHLLYEHAVAEMKIVRLGMHWKDEQNESADTNV